MNSESAFYILSILNGLLQLLCPRDPFLLVADASYSEAYSSEKNAFHGCHYFSVTHSFLSFYKHKEFPLTRFHFPFKHHTLCTDHKVESIKGSLTTFLKNYTSQGPGDLILRIACFFPTCLFFISPPWDDTPRIANETYMTLLGQAFSGLHRPWQLDRSVTMANISQLLCSILTDTNPCKYLQHQEFDKINNYTSPVPCALKPV